MMNELRELDAKVARARGKDVRQIGDVPFIACEYGTGPGSPTIITIDDTKYDTYRLPHFSTNIADAWALVEEMDAAYGVFYELANRIDDGYHQFSFISQYCTGQHVTATTVPEVICKAYLKWKEARG
jgi:hypothetical protein